MTKTLPTAGEAAPPLEIGGKVEMRTPLVLAPLAGHTDRAFRGLVRDLGGCGLVVTEMVSSEGLTRGSEFSKELAAISPNERPVGVQIFGNDPTRMGDAAAMVEEMGADLVDVNMGCPVPKVTRKGSGAALMKDTKRAAAVITRMVAQTSCPVTVKIRAGWDRDSINAPEFARALEDAGAAAITVHPRCRSERHRGVAAWSVIADVKRAVRIPVIGNGDVHGPESARQMFEETGVDAIMVGRGALMNPWVFRQITDPDAGNPDVDDYRLVFAGFLERLREHLPERIVLNRLKAFIGWVTKGLHKGHALRRDIYAAKTLAEVYGILDAHFETAASEKLMGQSSTQTDP
jgi:nifR3 family TIM-barrel protein